MSKDRQTSAFGSFEFLSFQEHIREDSKLLLGMKNTLVPANRISDLESRATRGDCILQSMK